jgi:hypothetical protein
MTTTVSHPKHFLLTDLHEIQNRKKDNVAYNHNVTFFKIYNFGWNIMTVESSEVRS